MKQRWIAATALLAALLAGCASSAHRTAGADPTPSSVAPSARSLNQLTASQMRSALLTAGELGVDGYLAESGLLRSSSGVMCGVAFGPDKTPRASEFFIKQRSTDFAAIGLGFHEFSSNAAARALFQSRLKALRTCSHFNADGVVWSIRSSALHGVGDSGITMIASASPRGIAVKSVNRAILLGNTILTFGFFGNTQPDPALVERVTTRQIEKLLQAISGEVGT